MKYIRKFNENITESNINDLLKDIFAELIDDASIQVEIKLETLFKEYGVTTKRICVDVKPWAKNQSKATKMETEEMVSRYEKYLELVKDIEVCYKRAVDELPDVKSELMVAVDNRIYIHFHLPVDPKTTMKWTDVDHMTDDELFRDID
jgi:hypothetical protein